ncbi:MAG: signal peptide peptidase SppA [Saprospiraceae bacterium]|nr:signal peptide peptidase SppA [Saprospiraceae bacterium]
MTFFKSVLSSCLGVFLAFILIILVFVGISSASFLSSETKPKLGLLYLDLSEIVPELTGNIGSSSFSLEAQPNYTGLQELKKLIDHAKTDDNVKGIVLDIKDTPNGASTLFEIVKSLKDFKESKKPVLAYIDNTSQNGYMVSSVADQIMMNPNGEIGLRGYGMMVPFVKDAADKLGIEFKIFYAGNFKSATESLRRTDISPENRLQSREFLAERMDVFKQILFQNRKLQSAKLDSIMNNILGRSAKLSLSNGLVDKIGYRPDFHELIASKTGLDADDLNYIGIDTYAAATILSNKGSFSNKIAVVYLEGDIMDGADDKGLISDKKYEKVFAKIRKDDKVKAVVLRVNSGGGSSYSSDIIWNEVELLKKKNIPVIASFGDYAASGGYYVACGADKIFAAPNTLTGSIGVFSILLKTKELFNEKLGITFDTVKTHNNAIYLSSNYDFSPKEEEVMKEMTEDIYDQFLTKVAKGRKMSKDSVHLVAQGRVWTGQKAITNGLVDELGNLDDAIAAAAKMAKVDDYRVSEFPYIEKEFWEELLQSLTKSSEPEAQVKNWLKTQNKSLYETSIYLEKLSKMEKVQAKLPFRIEE